MSRWDHARRKIKDIRHQRGDGPGEMFASREIRGGRAPPSFSGAERGNGRGGNAGDVGNAERYSES